MRIQLWLAAVLLTPFAVAPGARALELRRGDLLVVDGGVGNKVLHVDPATGVVQDFSPRNGGTNLLDAPAGIAIDPDGTIFVASQTNAQIIAIDPLTGAQSELVGTSGPLDVGTAPFGLDLSDLVGAPPDRRDLYVASEGALYTVQRSDVTTSASLLKGDPAFANARDLAIAEDAVALQTIWVATSAGIARYDASSGTVTVPYAPSGRVVADVDWRDSLVFAQIVCGTQNFDGVLAFDGQTASPLSLGGMVSCPEALAISDLDAQREIFVTDNGADGNTPTVAKLTEATPGTWVQSFVANLPAGTEPVEVEVSPVTFTPESDAASLSLAALGALRLLARRRAANRRETKSAG